MRKGELAIARAHSSVSLAAQRSNVSISMSVLQPLGLLVYLRYRDPKLLTNAYGGPRQEVTAYFTGPGQIAFPSAVPGRLIVGPSIHAKSGRALAEDDLQGGVSGLAQETRHCP